MYDYIFDGVNNSSRLLQGLAGRNVRRALDIFFGVMTSGHLAGDQLTSVALRGTGFPISDDQVLRAIMRRDNRFFRDGTGFVSNIFFFDQEWGVTNHFLVTEILYFLGTRIRTRGTIGIEGFFSVDAIAEVLQMLGYSQGAVEAAASWLLSRELLEADNMATNELQRGASLRLSSAGFIHLRLLTERLEYMAACLYELPYTSKPMAAQVGLALTDSIATGSLSRTRKAQTLQNFRKYLKDQLETRSSFSPNLTGVQSGADYILRHLDKAIGEAIRPLKPLPSEADDLDL